MYANATNVEIKLIDGSFIRSIRMQFVNSCFANILNEKIQ
jgi:hypothetical protein